MPVDFSIKQVSDDVANRLRERAAGNRRSLQCELLTIIEQAVAADSLHWGVDEPLSPNYSAKPGVVKDRGVSVGKPGAESRTKSGKKARTASADGTVGKLTLDQLWHRARQLGGRMLEESTGIVRRDRDARHGR